MIATAKWSSSELPSLIRNKLHEFAMSHVVCRLAPNGWIAGGALRSRLANDGDSDYDCYFKNSSDLQAAALRIESDRELRAKKKVDDPNLLSYETSLGKVDLVRKYHQDPDSTLNDFDFTVCCFAIDTSHNIYWLPEGLKHLLAKKLVLFKPSCPMSTMLRLQKYACKGYKMDLDNHAKLASLIQRSNISPTIDRIKLRGHDYNNRKTWDD